MSFAQISTNEDVAAERREKSYIALAQVFAWAKAVGLKMSKSESLQADAVVQTAGGKAIEVTICRGEEDASPTGINLSADLIKNEDLGVAFGEFHKVTTAAGIGTPTPVQRIDLVGVDAKTGKARKPNATEDTEALGLRHTEFRRVPNDPELAGWETEIQRMAKKNLATTNPFIRAKYDIDVDTVTNYVRAWTNTFLGMYYRHYKSREDNARLLDRHVRQRYNEFFKKTDSILSRKHRNIDAYDGHQTAEIALYQRVSAPNYRRGDGMAALPEVADHHEQLVDALDAKYHGQHREEQEAPTPTKSARDAERQAKRSELEEKLAKIGCEQVPRLEAVSADIRNVDPDTRDVAKRYLRTHRASCLKCTVQVPVTPTSVLPDPPATIATTSDDSGAHGTLLPTRRQPSCRVPVRTLPGAIEILAKKEAFAAELVGKTKCCRRCKEWKPVLEAFGIFWRKEQRVPYWASQNQCKRCRSTTAKESRAKRFSVSGTTASSVGHSGAVPAGIARAQLQAASHQGL